MSKFHINPDSGNVAICRAQNFNCPYQKELQQHYSTKKDAEKAYEDMMERPISEVSQLIQQRNMAQKIIVEMSKLYGYGNDLPPVYKEYCDKRNSIDKKLKSFSEGHEDLLDNDGYEYENSTIKLESLPDIDYDDFSRVGFSPYNDDKNMENLKSFWDSVNNASQKWLKNLSSEEALSVYEYGINTVKYKQSFIDGKNNHEIHKALKKAPKFEETTVYSGLGVYMRDTILKNVHEGKTTIHIPHIVSTSLNPAIVNSFMQESLELSDLVSLEIRTEHGGVMTEISKFSEEAEMILPPGHYEILEERKNVSYYWSDKLDSRRVANRTFIVKFTPQEA